MWSLFEFIDMVLVILRRLTNTLEPESGVYQPDNEVIETLSTESRLRVCTQVVGDVLPDLSTKPLSQLFKHLFLQHFISFLG